jgi:hypothetical protein
VVSPLAELGTPLQDITVDSVAVYVADGIDAVTTVPIEGGPASTLAADQGVTRGIAVEDGVVYWTSASAGTVGRAPAGGGPVTVLASEQLGVFGIAVGPDAIFWASSGGGTVSKLAR